MKKNILLSVVAIVALTAACNGNKTNSAAVTDTVAVSTLSGTYEGTLPAADCPGIETRLTINADSNYDLTSHYIGQKPTFSVTGVCHAPAGRLVELVTPSSNEKTYYKVLDDSTLILANDKGEEPAGELRKNYQLHKKAQ